jgi:hypothetical protein
MATPAPRHWELAKGLLKYLAGTSSHGIVYACELELELEGWTDADYATCKDTRKSRGGFVFTLGGGAISWSSKLQSVVATSTAESEYVASSFAAREAVWLRRICTDMGVGVNEPVLINADNQAAIKMAANSCDTARTKHIDVAYHYLRETVARNLIVLAYVNTADNAADVFTKPLAADKFKKFIRMIGVA